MTRRDSPIRCASTVFIFFARPKKRTKRNGAPPLGPVGLPCAPRPGAVAQELAALRQLALLSAPGLRCSAAGQREGQIGSSPFGQRSIWFPDVLLLPLRRAEHRSRGRKRSCDCLSEASLVVSPRQAAGLRPPQGIFLFLTRTTAPARGETHRAAPAGGRVARAFSLGYFSLAAKKSNSKML